MPSLSPAPATPPTFTPINPAQTDQPQPDELALPPIVVPTNPKPVKLLASLTVIPPEGDLKEIPTAPQPLSQTLISDTTDCVITPASLRYLGLPVGLMIAVSETGQVDATQTQVVESVDRETYDELAICYVNLWEFSPTLNRQAGTDTTTEALPNQTHALKVQVTITQPKE